MLQFLRNKNYVHKLVVPETVHYISFALKFIWNHMYLFIICIIYLESSIKVFSANLNITLTTSSSVKPSISGVTSSKNALWVTGIPILTKFIIFLSNSNIWNHLYFRAHMFSCYNSLVPLPFLLLYYIGAIIKWEIVWSDE